MGRRAVLASAALAAAALAAVIAATARGTVLSEVPFEAGARRASAVVLVRALDSTVGYGVTPGGRTRIYTSFRFEVESVLAGSVPTREIILPVIGGTIGPRRLIVHGTPEFAPGERRVLFLDPSEGFTGLVGWTQGAFRVERDPVGTDRVRFDDGTAIAGFEGGKALGGNDPIPLAEFAAAVARARTAVESGAAEDPR